VVAIFVDRGAVCKHYVCNCNYYYYYDYDYDYYYYTETKKIQKTKIMCRKLGENGVEHFFNKTLKNKKKISTKFAYVNQHLF